MNSSILVKWRKQVITNIILWLFPSIVGFVLVLTIPALIVAMAQEEHFILVPGILVLVVLLSLATVGVSIANLVFWIINTIHASDVSKIDGDNTPFILLIVGLFIGIIGIIGLFLLKRQLERAVLIKDQTGTNSSNTPSI